MDLTLIVAKTTVGQNSLPFSSCSVEKGNSVWKIVRLNRSVGPHGRTTNNNKTRHFIRTTAEWKQQFEQNAINTCALLTKNIFIEKQYKYLRLHWPIECAALKLPPLVCSANGNYPSGKAVFTGTLCLRFGRFNFFSSISLRSLCSSDTCEEFSASARANVCSNDRSPLHGPRLVHSVHFSNEIIEDNAISSAYYESIRHNSLIEMSLGCIGWCGGKYACHCRCSISLWLHGM